MANSFTNHIAAFIHSHHLIHSGDLILVAVSGGPDSLAMLHALMALRTRFSCTLHVVHLDHMLRGAESAAEALFVTDMAKQWGIPATIEARDVGLLAQQQRLNLYEAGRAARYQLFAHVALTIGAQAVAVAHTAQDQAETVLMHLLRGAGSEGLAGMRPHVAWEQWHTYSAVLPESDQTAAPDHAPLLIRPLLTTTRTAIEAYCTEQHLLARQDPSNTDTRHTRSRIRHNLLPRLIEYNPRIVEALCRTADTLASEHELIEQSLDAAWQQLATLRHTAIDLDLAIWQSLHPALQRAAMRRAYRLIGGQATLGLADLERVDTGITRGVGHVVELPGAITLTVGYTTLTLGDVVADGPQLMQDLETFAIPGQMMLQHGWRLVATIQEQAFPNTNPWILHATTALLNQPFMVRKRRSGDRINGRRGSRSIQDIMVDAKLPKALRAAWPIVVAGKEIIWIVGVRVADRILANRGEPTLRIEMIKPTGVVTEE